MRRPALVLLALLLALLLAVAACRDDETAPVPTAGDDTSSSTTLRAPSTSRGTIPPFEEVAVELSADGTHLVDGQGRAVYRFMLDTDRTPTCLEACAEAWPPFLGDPVPGPGVDPALVGNGERPDGSIQVTYGGFPLYFYSGDAFPGATEGHGFNDVWFLVGPDGEPLDG